MNADECPSISASQVPSPGAINLDHIAHFVPDGDAASAVLERLGFTLTPFSSQSHRLEPGGPLVPAGTGNRCVMLERGYLEFLTPTGDTPIADQLRTAIRRYTGVHLVAFGTADPEADHARLAREGFTPVSPVALQRPISTEDGDGTARFTVVRVPPGTMPEGRIQYCAQLTPELVWQTRWVKHANGATELSGVMLCVEDPEDAARRYARFTGLAAARDGARWTIRTARGIFVFADAGNVKHTLGAIPPSMPWIAGYALRSRKLQATRGHLARSGFAARPSGDDAFSIVLPDALGGTIVFHDQPDFRFERP